MDNHIKHPAISVIMPVYNSEKYLHEAIESILNQTFKDFEFIIIDDASTDKSVKIIKSYTDKRIILIQKPVNTGYTESLNRGIGISKGEYIARMDSDDVSIDTRFEKQKTLMDNNPSIIACGSNYIILHTSKQSDHPCNPDDLRINLLSGCYIAHPSVMFRRQTFIQNKIEYDVECEPAEDYNLWVRLSKLGELSNISEPLIKYRIHDSQISNTKALLQIKQADKARLEMVSEIMNIKDPHSQKIHLAIIKTQLDLEVTLLEIENWIEDLKRSNFQLRVYNNEKLHLFLEKKKISYIKHYFIFRKGFNFSILKELFSTKKKYYKLFSLIQISKIIIKFFIYRGPKK